VPESRRPPAVIVFDLDGTLLDDMRQVSVTAGKVLNEAFGTPRDRAEVDYLRTTGKPFELQVKELYPDATPFEQLTVTRRFHEAKVKEAYAHATFFPDVPRLLKTLDRQRYVQVVSTGGEREMAELLLEREGLRFFFEEVQGAGQGTKDVHLRAYRARWKDLPLVLVGDSRFDMEVARTVPGVTPVGRACHLPGWSITPADLKRWGARWADYTLAGLPEALPGILRSPGPRPRSPREKGPGGPGVRRPRAAVPMDGAGPAQGGGLPTR
jgi:phosphoglycolate phosphatase-like HAD superfamily hydrolase